VLYLQIISIEFQFEFSVVFLQSSLLLMQQAGLIQYAEKRSAVPYNRCSVTEAKKIAANKAVPLKLRDLAGAFVIIALGSTLSFIVVFVECILKKIGTK